MISEEPNFTVRCELANILDLGPAPFGHRRVVNILGGPVTGAKLNGRVGVNEVSSESRRKKRAAKA